MTKRQPSKLVKDPPYLSDNAEGNGLLKAGIKNPPQETHKNKTGIVTQFCRAFSISRAKNSSKAWAPPTGLKRNQSDSNVTEPVSKGLQGARKLFSYPSLSSKDKALQEFSFEMIEDDEIENGVFHGKILNKALSRLPSRKYLTCHGRSTIAMLDRLEKDPVCLVSPHTNTYKPIADETIPSTGVTNLRKISPSLSNNLLQRSSTFSNIVTIPIISETHLSQKKYGIQDAHPSRKLSRVDSRPLRPPLGPRAMFITSTPARRIKSVSDLRSGPDARKPGLISRKPVPQLLDLPLSSQDGHISGVSIYIKPADITSTTFKSNSSLNDVPPIFENFEDSACSSVPLIDETYFENSYDSYEQFQDILFKDVLNTWGLPSEFNSQSPRKFGVEAFQEKSIALRSNLSRSQKKPSITFAQLKEQQRQVSDKPFVPVNPRLRAIKSMDERRLRKPVGRVKDIVDMLEGYPGHTSTPVKELGEILQRPCSVSSENLGVESKMLMENARQRAIAQRVIHNGSKKAG
ncbi:hypothetical protein L204_103235 [Cryptococcus depauperatus]